MNNSRHFIVAMAEKCRDVISDSENIVHGAWLPSPLRPRHLLWMCQKILSHAEFAPDTKLHRWIGFVQAGMMANRMLDLDGVRAILDEASTMKSVALPGKSSSSCCRKQARTRLAF